MSEARSEPTPVDLEDEHLDSVHISSDDPVKDYLRAIGRHELLTAEDEVELAKEIEAGLYADHLLEGQEFGKEDEQTATIEELERLSALGRAAMDRFVTSNLRLVVNIAKKSNYQGMSFLDAIQEGNGGMIHAVEKFDYTKGWKFSTYATWWIRQSISRSVSQNGRTIRLPVHFKEELDAFIRLKNKLDEELGREPTDQELAEKIDKPIDHVQLLRRSERDAISLNKRISTDGDTELGDLLVDATQDSVPDHFEQLAAAHQMTQILDQLTPREADVLHRRYGLSGSKPETLDSIAQSYGLTRERIRQIESIAKRKLRNSRDIGNLAVSFGYNPKSTRGKS